MRWGMCVLSSICECIHNLWLRMCQDFNPSNVWNMFVCFWLIGGYDCVAPWSYGAYARRLHGRHPRGHVEEEGQFVVLCLISRLGVSIRLKLKTRHVLYIMQIFVFFLFIIWSLINVDLRLHALACTYIYVAFLSDGFRIASTRPNHFNHNLCSSMHI